MKYMSCRNDNGSLNRSSATKTKFLGNLFFASPVKVILCGGGVVASFFYKIRAIGLYMK